MWTRLALSGLIIMAIGLTSDAVDTPDQASPQYEIKVLVYRLLGDAWQEGVQDDVNQPKAVSKTGEEVERSAEMTQGPVVVQKSIRGHQVEFRGDSVVWDGKPDSADPNIIVVARPVLAAAAGEEARVAVGEDPPEYFALAGEEHPGLYKHGKAKSRIGFELSCTVVPTGRKDIVTVKFKEEHTALKERMKLDGVGLDVGPPVLSTARSESEGMLPLGEWLCLSVPTGDGNGVVFLVGVNTLSPSSSAGVVSRKALEANSVSARKYLVKLRFLEAASEDAEHVLQHFEVDAHVTPRVGNAQFLHVSRAVQEGKTIEAFADTLVEAGAVCIASPSLIVATRAKTPETTASGKAAADPNKDELFGTQGPDGSTGWALVTSRRDVPLRKKGRTSASGQPDNQVDFDFRGFEAGVCICPTNDRQQITLDVGFRNRRDCEEPKKGAAAAPGEAEEAKFAFQVPARLGEWIGFTTTYPKTGLRTIVLAMITEEPAAEEDKVETIAVTEAPKAPEAEKAAPAETEAAAAKEAPKKYWTSLHFLEVAPEDAERILGHFEVSDIPKPIAGKPQFLKDPPAAQEGKTLDDFVSTLVDSGAVCHLSPQFDLEAKPKLSQQDPREGRVPRELRELVAKLPQVDSSDWAVSTWGHSVRVPAKPETDSTQRVDDKRTPQRRRAENQPKYDFRGFKACTFIRPTEDAQQVLLDAAFVGKRDYESAETPGDAEETQFACETAVRLGEWFGFMTTYEKTGRCVVVIGEVRDKAPAQEEGEAMLPRPSPGLQVSAETTFLRIPAQHRATVMDALVVDGTVKPLLGNVTVFRDINTSAFPKVAAGNRSQLAFSTLYREWLGKLEPEIELLSAPRVTTLSKKAAAEMRRQIETQPEASRRPCLRGANGVQSIHGTDAEGQKEIEERTRALYEVNPVLQRMVEERIPGLAIIVDSSSYMLPDGAIDWLGVLVGVSVDESETLGFLDTEVTLDYRWDAALPQKRLLGVFPFKHERDIQQVQAGVRLNVPDEGWVGFLFPWAEGEDGIMVLLLMDTIEPTGARFFESTGQTQRGAEKKVVERRAAGSSARVGPKVGISGQF